MATSFEPDTVGLFSQSTGRSLEDSFEHIDGVFDEAFDQELTGKVTADYIPLDQGEIFLRKGDRVTVTQETLDRNYFIVMNKETGESGKISKEFVSVDKEKPQHFDNPDKLSKFIESSDLSQQHSYKAEESNIDEKSPSKKPHGLVRRPRVIKKKKSPFSQVEENGVEESTNGDWIPLVGDNTMTGNECPQSQEINCCSSLARNFTASEIPASPIARLRELTREDRAQTLQVLPESRPEFKLIQKYNIMSVSGADRDGRPVIVFSACRLPAAYLINHQRLLEYALLTLDKYVEQDYTLVYFHHGFTSENKPSFSWLRQVYRELDRKYKKNIKKFYIVHPTNFIRLLFYVFKPFISYKFGQKLMYINRLDELRPALYLDQIDIPTEVKKYDSTLTSPVRDVTHTDSRSVFHIPVGGAHSPVVVSADTVQFGVPLEILRERNHGDPVPLVLKICIQYLEENGLEVMGIFRRAPSNATVHEIKRRFDTGAIIDFKEYDNYHLPAVLIKLFLRELPVPLLTFESYNHIMEIKGKSEDYRLNICDHVINSLPETNYIVLRYVISFLTKVAAKQEINKMTPLNLAIVFGPNLIWSTNVTASLVSLGEINTFTFLLIQHFETIFTR